MKKENNLYEEYASNHAMIGIEHAIRTAVLLGVKISVKALGKEIKDIWCEKTTGGITIVFSDKEKETSCINIGD